MGFFDFINEILDDSYKTLTITEGSRTYTIRAKLIYSFPRIKFYESKDQGYFAVGSMYVRGSTNKQESFIQKENLFDFESSLFLLDIIHTDFYKMFPDLYGMDFYNKLSNQNKNKCLVLGGTPNNLEDFYFSQSYKEFDEGTISILTVLSAFRHMKAPKSESEDFDFYWLKDGKYFFDGGTVIDKDGTILSGGNFLLSQDLYSETYNFLSTYRIQIKVPQYLKDVGGIDRFKGREDVFIF